MFAQAPADQSRTYTEESWERELPKYLQLGLQEQGLRVTESKLKTEKSQRSKRESQGIRQRNASIDSLGSQELDLEQLDKINASPLPSLPQSVRVMASQRQHLKQVVLGLNAPQDVKLRKFWVPAPLRDDGG